MMKSISMQNLLRNSLYYGLHKNKKNPMKFVDLKYTYSDLDVCHSYVAQNIEYLNKFFYMLVG
jgi:hypothetical protein